MIVVTGAAGFISSCLITDLLKDFEQQIVAVDDFSVRPDKDDNLAGKNVIKVQRGEFIEWIDNNHKDIDYIIHLGARTDTAEMDVELFNALNLNYTKSVWTKCANYEIPLIYASSAATYGLGEYGYKDDHKLTPKLLPLNPYGRSKNDFDKWMLKQEKQPPFWAGLKFFNVYGPNEFHKGRMASVIFHAFNQISSTDAMKLFRSHNPKFKNGEQLRDFIYVKDISKVIRFLMNERPESGLYNLGTGQCRTFLDLVNNTFEAMGKTPSISYIDTPADIRDNYQYYTQADMSKLLDAGYKDGFSTLEEGVADYVKNYLLEKKYY